MLHSLERPNVAVNWSRSGSGNGSESFTCATQSESESESETCTRRSQVSLMLMLFSISIPLFAHTQSAQSQCTSSNKVSARCPSTTITTLADRRRCRSLNSNTSSEYNFTYAPKLQTFLSSCCSFHLTHIKHLLYLQQSATQFKCLFTFTVIYL